MTASPQPQQFGTRPPADATSIGDTAGGPSFAVVRLDRLAANLRAIRAAVGVDRDIMMPVKADAYGHGAVAVSRYVERHGLAEWLAVATIGEASELRAAGITLPIFKLSPCLAPEFISAFRLGVTVPVGSVQEARAAQEAATQLGIRARVHLKIDSGMRRVGVDAAQVKEVATTIAEECPDLRVEGAYTHFAVSDTDTDEATSFTREQLRRFQVAVAEACEALGYLVECVHAANSGAVLAHPEAWGSLVRPGIMTYGYYPDPSTPRTIELAPVLEWRCPLTQVKRVSAGDTVSYGRTWTAESDTWVGTLPVGYADGYRRALSNRGTVLAGGAGHQVIGRVCMDQLMIDLGTQTRLQAGDEVVLLGADGEVRYDADDMAAVLDTIPYEVLTGIGRRVERRFVE